MAPDEGPRVAKLTQDRAHRTRHSLVEAASALWSERGYDAVAVSDICERAGVSKGTFFYYFPTKEHLLVELVAAGGAEAVAAAVDERLTVGAPLLDVLQHAVSVVAAGQQYAPRGAGRPRDPGGAAGRAPGPLRRHPSRAARGLHPRLPGGHHPR